METKLKKLEEAVMEHRKSLSDIEKLIDEKAALILEKDVVTLVDKKNEVPVSSKLLEEGNGCSAAVGLGLQAKSEVNVSWT